jgi:hypothetical protein
LVVRGACSSRGCSATCKRSADLAMCSIHGRPSAASRARISCALDDQRPRSVVAASSGCDGASVGFDRA